MRFAEASEKAVKVRLRIALLDGLFGMGIQTLTALGTTAALYIGVAAAQRGAPTVGQVLLGLHYLNQVYSPLKTLGKKWASLQNQMAGLERATSLLTEPTELKLTDLRTQLAVVFQETVLLPGTLAENIAVGKPGATLPEIEAAARAAQLHEAIQRFPDGYNTKVGERGAALSGGERQRVGLARAFLRNAPILLLDEPTSALEATTEQEVLSAMERLMEGRTVLLVTHRASALQGMDRVLRVQHQTICSDAGRFGYNEP